jgi:hypothetical protein
MKKVCFSFLLITIVSLTSKAQKGNNKLSINVEAAIANDVFGPGFFGKYAYGIGKSSQLTFSAGITAFGTGLAKPEYHVTKTIPFLVGYKYNFNRFFVEPQIGIGTLNGKVDIGGDVARPSVAAAYGGIGAGYYFNSKLNIGVRFLAANGIENSSAGMWNDKNFNYTSLFVGYNIFRKNR